MKITEIMKIMSTNPSLLLLPYFNKIIIFVQIRY